MPVAGQGNAAREKVLVAVDRAFAELVKLSFLKNGAVDLDRAFVEIEAVLRIGGGDTTNMSGGYAQSWRTQLAAGKAELHIDRARYSGPMLRKGDRVQAKARPGTPWFEVLRVDDRGETRLVAELGEI